METIPIYCINLDDATDRWHRLQRRLAPHGLTATRRAACTPEDVDTSGCTFAPHLGPNHRACALSHFRLWEHCLAQGHDRVLILEDDAVFRHDWRPIVDAWLTDAATPPWHALFLNAAEDVDPPHTWQPARHQCLTAAYLITRAALQWLVQTFRSCQLAADHMTQHVQMALPCYTYFPWLVIQEGADTYVQTPDHLNADAAKVRRLLAACAYPLDNYGF
jgi:GR25 family glycosyltransferase involved in LPS biosynthesis